MRRLLSGLLAVLGVLGGTLVVAPPAAAADGRYVALGDSYAAGLGLASTDSSGCGRATQDYPRRVADALGLDLVDVTCSGATIPDLTASQQVRGRGVAPQFDALTADTRLVTLTMGGNDLGFGTIAGDCASLSGADGPVRGGDGNAATCESLFVSGSTDSLRVKLEQQIRPALDTALAQIRQRAPDAAVVVVDYPAIVPDSANTPSGGCWSSPLQEANALPFTDADLPYLAGVQAQLDQTLADAASAAGAGVATVYRESLDHTACSDSPWVNGVQLSGFSLAPSSLHPNEAGVAAMAAAATPVARDLLAGASPSAAPTIAAGDGGAGVPGWVWGAVAVAAVVVVLVAVGAFRVARVRRR